MPIAKSERAFGKIDRLMEKASRALEQTDYFECERLCLDAFELAHTTSDYDRMARILLPIQEARRQKRLAAIDVKRLYILEEPIPETEPVDPGCYLLQPPLVGADGRDLRERADHEEVPVFALVREPKNRLGMWPIVMIGPVTVRTRIKPPKNENKPDLAWFLGAAEALGDEAISQVAPDLQPAQRVEALCDRLGTVSEHEKIHQALANACREAAVEAATHAESKGPHSKRTGVKPASGGGDKEE